jgi:hypothetical protein
MSADFLEKLADIAPRQMIRIKTYKNAICDLIHPHLPDAFQLLKHLLNR